MYFPPRMQDLNINTILRHRSDLHMAESSSTNRLPSGLYYKHLIGGRISYAASGDFNEALDGMPECASGLCIDCQQHGFSSAFDPFRTMPRFTMSLNAAFQRMRECRFCSAVATAASKWRELVDLIPHHQIACVVLPQTWSTVARNACPCHELCVFIQSKKDVPEAPWISKQFLHRAGGELMNPDIDYIADRPLLVLELVKIEAIQTKENQAPPSPSTSPGSEGSDFVAEYEENIAANWHVKRLRRPIPPYMNTALIKNWLRAQDEKDIDHSKSDEEDKRMPMKLSLELLARHSRFRVADVVTGEVKALQQTPRFVALSYVWGGILTGHAITYSATRPEYGTCWTVDWKRAPKTIRHARDLVIGLGLQYIWIDALCIDQRDSMDKQVIIPQMGVIYRNEYVTIAAVSGSDADYGLPGVVGFPRKTECLVEIETHGNRIMLAPKRPGQQTLVDRSIWSTRGWTCQEYLLSMRILLVTDVETFLARGTLSCYERYTYIRLAPALKDRSLVPIPAEGTPPDQSDVHKELRKSGLPSWSCFGNALVAFSKRNLTHPGDRLAAFLGLYDRFRESTYTLRELLPLSGLPPQWFYASLLWVRWFEPGVDVQRIPFSQTQSRALPSWSWVGWSGMVTLHENRLKFGTGSIKPQIIDDANIVCDTLILDERQHWPQMPTPCPITPRDGIVLHLYTRRIDLVMRPIGPSISRLRFQSEEHGESFQVGSVNFDSDTASSFPRDHKHPFIVLGNYLMLVEEVQGYYERRGLGVITLFEDFKPRFKAMIEEHGKLEHIMLK